MAPIDTLLQVEYLQTALYQSALASTTLLPATGALRGTVTLLRDHSTGHIAQLRALGATAAPPAAADLTGGGTMFATRGPFAGALDTVPTFLRLAQLMKDLSVRVYLAQTIALTSPMVTRSALTSLQGAESRHAAMIRRLRAPEVLDPKPWITGVSAGAGYGTAVAPAGGIYSQVTIAALVYGVALAVPGASTAEDNLQQGNFLVAPGPSSTEAFDEPMPEAATILILSLFGIS